MCPQSAEEAAGFLRTTKLFDVLSSEELAIAAQAMAQKKCARGENIVQEGAAGEECFLIVSGRAAVVSPDLVGQLVILGELGPGDLIGEGSLIGNAPRTATVRALDEVTAYVVPRAFFERLLAAAPQRAEEVASHVRGLALRNYLRKSSPFAELPEDALCDLAKHLRFAKVPRGEVFVREGEAGSQLFLIYSGRFAVTILGQRQREMEAGECFGEVALLLGGPRTATLTAVADSEVLVLEKPDFDAILLKHPAVAAHFAELSRIRHPAGAGHWAALSDPLSTLMPFLTARHRWTYLWFLMAGTAATVIICVLGAQGESKGFSLLGMLLGSFLGPVAFMMYIVEAQLLASRKRTLLWAFLLGGLVAIPIAFILEVPVWSLILSLFGDYARAMPHVLWIGLAEESAKVWLLLWFLRRRDYRFDIDGLIFGLAVGMGFETFEDVMYALQAFATAGSQGGIGVMILRQITSPFTHGTWTATIGAAIWAARNSSGWRGWAGVAGAFLWCVCLHAAWDYQVTWTLPWLICVGMTGLLVLRQIFRHSLREQAFSILALNPRLAKTALARPGLECRVCAQLGVPGAHYCARCGAVLKRAPLSAVAA